MIHTLRRFSFYFRDREHLSPIITPLLRDLMQAIDSITNYKNNSNESKLFVFSGHDVNILSKKIYNVNFVIIIYIMCIIKHIYCNQSI